jgi:ABC-type arginine transport system permease subunit
MKRRLRCSPGAPLRRGRGNSVRLAVFSLFVAAVLAFVPAATASDTPAQTAALCNTLFASTYGVPSS